MSMMPLIRVEDASMDADMRKYAGLIPREVRDREDLYRADDIQVFADFVRDVKKIIVRYKCAEVGAMPDFDW
jgi:hypothetical protein